MRFLSAASLLGCVIMLQGCSDAMDLDCNDDDNKQTVLDILDQHLSASQWYREMKPGLDALTVENIKTRAADDSLGQKICAADLSFTYYGRPFQHEIEYDLDWLQDKEMAEVSLALDDIRVFMMSVGVTVPRPAAPAPDVAPAPAPEAESQPDVAAAEAAEAEVPLSAAQQACVDAKVAAYHQEMGDDALVRYDMLGEWEGECRQ